jgi:hypothetical protein
MLVVEDGISAKLDEIAKKIRSTADYYERAAAILVFGNVCKDSVEPLNPALEAASRSIALVNPLKPF